MVYGVRENKISETEKQKEKLENKETSITEATEENISKRFTLYVLNTIEKTR